MRNSLRAALAAVFLPGLACAQALPDAPLIARLDPHDRPGPYPVPRAIEAGIAPIFNPYRRDRITPGPGILQPMLAGTQSVRLGGGYAGAGDARETFGQGMFRHGPIAAMASGAWRDIGDYRDGAGQDVRFGYERLTGNLGVNLTPQGGTVLRLGALYDDIEDLRMPLARPVVEYGVPLVAGAGADPLTTRRMAVRAGAEHQITNGPRLRFDGGYVNFDRVADNFTLRPFLPQNRVRSEIDADVLDARLILDDTAGAIAWRLGADVRNEGRNGRRFGGPATSLALLSGRQAPDVTRNEFGVFGEAAITPWREGRIALALRLEHVEADAGAADDLLRVGNFVGTPRSLYASYFGADVQMRRSFTEPSVLLRLDQKLGEGAPTLHAAAARIARMPAIEELFFALPSATVFTPQGTPSRQVGNPRLSPELHHRLEAGLAWQGKNWQGWMRPPPEVAPGLDVAAWRFSLAGHASYVEDFITRDRARGQAGVLLGDYAAIWRNADAALAGIEADLQWNLTRNLATRVNLGWNWGENRDTGVPLYGIAPLEANLVAEWHDRLGDFGRWSFGAKLRLVAAQNRADINPQTGSGYDVDQSDSFALLDLFATFQLQETVAVRLGIDNVTGVAFAEHVPFRTTDDTNFGPVRGPGRFAWARALVTF